jgi:hypothetical protein
MFYLVSKIEIIKNTMQINILSKINSNSISKYNTSLGSYVIGSRRADG